MPLRQQHRQRPALAFTQHYPVTDHDQQQRQQQLVEIGRGQRGKSPQIRARAGIGEHRGILTVAFQKDRLARYRIHPRIEGGQRRRGAEGIVSVMHHAVRMAIGLGKERRLGAGLPRSAGGGLVRDALGGEKAGDDHEHCQHGARQQHHARAGPQAPFLTRDPPHHAALAPCAAKAA